MLNLKLGTPREMTANLKSALTTAKQAQDQMRDSIKAIRSQIADLKARREAILSLPVTEDVAAERVGDWLDKVIGSYIASWRSGTTHWQSAPPDLAQFTKPFTTRGKNGAEWNVSDRDINLPALIAIYLRDEIIAEMLAKLSAMYSDGLDNVSEAQRAEQLNAIDQQILDYELAEESIIRAAVRSGLSIQRRPDVSSAVVEASDAELP